MALPPIDMSADLEEQEPVADDESLEGEEPSGDVDPIFAADVAEALPDLDDTQIAALQRAILGLIAGGGGAPPAPPAPGGMGF